MTMGRRLRRFGTRSPQITSALVVAFALAMSGAACRSAGEYVWVDAYRDPVPPRSGSTIGRGDLLSVRVWNQESMSSVVRVRGDGMISLHFVNDVEAAGLAPAALARRIEGKLKDFVVHPAVTVSLQEAAPVEVSVIGEVTHPGAYRFDQDAGVLRALASAGGLTPVASRSRVFVLRKGDVPGDPSRATRIRFDYATLERAEGQATRFRLRSGDVVVVE